MQDIDFDEIDRAVTAATKPTRRTRPAPVKPAAIDLTSVEKTDVPPTPLPVTDTPEPVASPAIRRTSGRFMDVVHPSSDMRSKAPSAPSLHRDGADRSTVIKRPLRPQQTVAPVPHNDDIDAGFHWPEPIDIGSRPDSVRPEQPEHELELIVEERVVSGDAATQPAATPLESPFLLDTKVEKRPLGGFSTELEQPQSASVQLPRFTDTTEMAHIEDSFVSEPVAPQPVVHIEQEPSLLLEADYDDASLPPNEPVAVSQQPVVDIPAGPVSISQQYKEQPSSNDTSGAIYDTESYHQPLTHAVKKKSGALIIIWILAIIIFGGGIGAAIFYFLIPML